jgi:protein-L-isoaspartate O-methyltransferase
MMDDVSGTQRYAEGAVQHVERWESINLSEGRGGILHLLANPQANILDIDTGSGRDAAALGNLVTELSR